MAYYTGPQISRTDTKGSSTPSVGVERTKNCIVEQPLADMPTALSKHKATHEGTHDVVPDINNPDDTDTIRSTQAALAASPFPLGLSDGVAGQSDFEASYKTFSIKDPTTISVSNAGSRSRLAANQQGVLTGNSVLLQQYNARKVTRKLG